MIQIAFSTVACPEWTLERVASTASSLGYDAVELRTFGHASSHFACDPTLTGAAKVRRLFADAGVKIACLATSVSFHEPIWPPVVGRLISDTTRTVRAAKSAIDLAAQIECPLVRVFGYEFDAGERRADAMARIVERLAQAVDAARNTGVRVVVENGGSFGTSAEVQALIEQVGDRSNLLGAAYSNGAGVLAGEDPAAGVRALGDQLWLARVMDFTPGGQACMPGEGRLHAQAFAEAVGSVAGSRDVPLVFEWDRSWLDRAGTMASGTTVESTEGISTPLSMAPAESTLPEAARRLREWTSTGAVRPGSPRNAAAGRFASA